MGAAQLRTTTSSTEAMRLARANGDAGPGRVNVLGIGVSALNLDGAVRLVLRAVASRNRGYVCVSGVHGIIESRSDAELRQIHNRAMAVTPDGMPLVWALRRGGHPEAGRVYGPDLMRAAFRAGREAGLRHFLYGTTPDVLERLTARLTESYPGNRIVGTYSPPFRPLTPDEEAQAAAIINRSGADIVWVGLSTPKQERWMAGLRPTLEAPVLIGVGAAFDFIAGNKRAAPPALQRAGLEWAYRLATEPRRLWRRYVRIVPAYLLLRTLQVLGWRRFPLADDPLAGASVAASPAGTRRFDAPKAP